MANYVEGKICDKVADGAEHELRRELSKEDEFDESSSLNSQRGHCSVG